MKMTLLRIASLFSLLISFQSADGLSLSIPEGSPCAMAAADTGSMGAMHLAVCLHKSGDMATALEVYQHLLKTDPNYAYTHVNLGAYYSTAGKPAKAIDELEQYFNKVGGVYGDQSPIDVVAIKNGTPCRIESPDREYCVNALNNLASVHLSEGKNSSATLYYLTRAIEIGDEHMLTNVYANLAGHFNTIGDDDAAADAFIKTFWINLKQNNLNSAVGALVRRALLMPAVLTSMDQTELQRILFQQRIRDVTELARVGGSFWENDNSDLFRVRSGLSHPSEIKQIPILGAALHSWTDGYYDLPIQQEVFAMFTELCPPNLFEVAPHLLAHNKKQPSEKKKVGFISSLIGNDEPHGLLVLDVIRSLSSTEYFEFFVISNGPKAPSEEFYRVTNGKVFVTGFDENKAKELLKSLELDCLVYLEAMNDAMMYFLGYQRYAEVQILAMGSPVTSGIETFDYFVSGDLLEHPFRTQLKTDHYSEQVVLFDGQAISFPEKQYHPRQDAALAAGDARVLSTLSPLDEMKMLRRRNANIYLCFQSIFKIQPLFDFVMADILQADIQGHIVLQASRHANQTSTLQSRIQTVLSEKFCGTPLSQCPAMMDAYARVHFIARVTSDKVLDLMQQASVILHPFPFGGSKTAFDAINAGIPIVTYPQQYLRGRMAAVFIRNMDLHEIDPDLATCCIASSISDYVAKALRLASDENYRTRVRHAFQERRTRIFQDESIALEWGKLLTRALGVKATEEDLLSRMGIQRKLHQQDDYFAKKVVAEQSRWRQSALLSAVTSPR